MPNEVKGQIDSLQTTIRWDEDTAELVTILKLWVKGITPDQLRQLFLFQSSGALTFSITSAQGVLEEAVAAAGSPELPKIYQAKSD